MKKVIKYLFIFLVLFGELLSQTHLLKSNRALIDLKSKQNQFEEKEDCKTIAYGLLDTLSYQQNGDFDVELSMGVQDVLVQWFQAPADMIIKALGYRCSKAGDPVSFRLVKLDWSESEARQIFTPQYIGYYPSEEDGYNNAGAFPYEATGEWIDKTNGEYSMPFDPEDWVIWEDDSFGWPILPEEKDSSDLSYEFFETSNLGYEPGVRQGDIIGVVISNTFGESTTKFWSREKNTEYEYEIPGWKYFEYGKETPEEPGWWVTDYVFDFALIVEFVHDTGIHVSYVTQLYGTIGSTDPREVCCTAWSRDLYGHSIDMESVELIYSVNNGSEFSIEMDNLGNNEYCGYIPGQDPGDEILYYIRATDINGNSASSSEYFYNIFSPNPEADALLVFHESPGFGYPEEFYFRKAPQFNYDIWAYGELTAELVNNYSNIYEICLSGPEDDNKQVIRQWLNSDLTHNYFLSGDEFLGRFHDYKDSSFLPGDFEYDVLGIEHSYNDVSYDGSNGQDSISALFPVEGSILTDDLFHYLRNEGHDSVIYNPIFEIGLTNWIDAFEPIDSTEVQMFVKTRGINNQPNIDLKPTLIARKYNSSNKIVFAGFDTFSLDLDSSPHSQGENYFWIGDTTLAPHYQALSWFNEPVNVKEENVINNFHLSQNYPNPFNPTTRIKYQVASIENVSLKVYDILGREIVTLIDNKPMQPGEYEVEFNAGELSSGIYFYKLKSGTNTETKKMMLLR